MLKKRNFKALLLSFILIFSHLQGTDFVLFTEPKTGTHLLIPILESLTGKKVYWPKEFFHAVQNDSFLNVLDLNDPDHFFFSVAKAPWNRMTMELVWKITKNQKAFLHLHAPYSPTMETYLAGKKCINFFVKRDPRDQAVSLLNHYKYIDPKDERLKNFSSDDDKLLFIIENNFREKFLYFKGWQQSPICCVLDFHKLMGSHGGAATDLEALDELRKIAKALSLSIPDDHLLRIYQNHFGKGWSFFRGKVGSWKDYFKEEHKAAAKKEIGDLLIELGYEKDDQW